MRSNLPPIGALAMRRADVIDLTRNPVVFRVVAIYGRVTTSAGVLVSPSPSVVLQGARTGGRITVRACDFARDWQWEVISDLPH